jgi:hypothetical protein
MNGMLSNSRGLGDLAKHLHIAHCIKDHNLDFVAILETGRRDFSQRLLNRLAGGVDFEWTAQPPEAVRGYSTWSTDGHHGSYGSFGWRLSH